MIKSPRREISTRTLYATLLGSRIRSQLAYRASFAVDVFNSLLIGLLVYIEIYVILHNVPLLGGLNLAQASLVFALSNLGFALGDLVCGQLDSIPTYLRMGRLEAFLVRPMPLMAQMITADFQLRRVGRALAGVVILIIAVSILDLDLSPAQTVLLIMTPIVGGVIYAAFFALAGGIQFFLIDGSEFTNAFTYGGAYAGQLPGSVLVAPIRVLFTFVIPATVTGYLPGLVIMGLPGPAFLPSWLGWCGPLFAVWIWLIALFAWRTGIRRFTGAGG